MKKKELEELHRELDRLRSELQLARQGNRTEKLEKEYEGYRKAVTDIFGSLIRRY